MKNLQIGKSGIEVPFLGMGTWAIGGGAWWGDNDDSLSVKAIQTAVEQGIRWIDTAPIYGLYHSEEVVGEAMKHIDRDKVVLSTKCGLEWRHETPVLHKVVDGVTVYRDLSAQSIIEDVEDSLRRLHTDHLDVLYTHWQSPDFGLYPLEATVEAMMKLKDQGKIHGVGAGLLPAGAGLADRQGDHGHHLPGGQHPQLEPQLSARTPGTGPCHAEQLAGPDREVPLHHGSAGHRPDRPHGARPVRAVRCPHPGAGD